VESKGIRDFIPHLNNFATAKKRLRADFIILIKAKGTEEKNFLYKRELQKTSRVLEEKGDPKDSWCGKDGPRNLTT